MGLTDIILIYFKRFLKVSSLLFIILTLLLSKAFAEDTFVTASYISNKETEYAMALDDNKAIFDYTKNINGFNIKVSSNYSLMSKINDYGANIMISNTF